MSLTPTAAADATTTQPLPRIGLLGGSFDPPHLGHLALGRAARAALGLAEVRWLPAGAPWQKARRQLAPAPHRAAMLGLLLDGEPGAVVDTIELDRDGPTYTLDTVLALQGAHPNPAEWVLILGQDQYGRFDTWHRWAELLDHVVLAVAARAGQAPQPPAALAGRPHQVLALPMPRLDISASDIRARVARGEPVVTLVGDRVARYIDQNHLYLGDNRH